MWTVRSVAQSPLQKLFENVPNLSGAAEQPKTISGTIPPIGGEGIEFSEKDGLITLLVRDQPLSKVLQLLAEQEQLNIVASNDIDAMISITVHKVPIEEALTAILEVANYTWVKRNNIILVTSLAGAANLPPDTQGRQIQVFELDFASADIIARAIENFLSPIGKASVSTITAGDSRLAREIVVVEDLPASLARIASYIHQIDQPPRQVLLEAHIFQVNLKDVNEHGVNFDALMRAAGTNFTIKSAGLASSNASPAFLATLEGGDLGTVIECLQATTDTKTLGSPKLLVLNGQEATFHAGESIGYQGSQTTTETSTFQNVQFLEVGVILSITPQITRDNRVLLHIEPEVSTGQINATTQVPDKSTTELQTDVMLNDGQGMIIGGLIKENDSMVQSKIPWLGNVRGLGWFLRREELTKERAEIIIAVLPRIQPHEPMWQAYEQGEFVRASVPLFHGPLKRTDRPWDAVLPDGRRVTMPLKPRQAIQHYRNYPSNWPPESRGYVIPTYPMPQQEFQGETIGPVSGQPVEGSRGPFLSDDLSPTPAMNNAPRQQGQVISDQR
jgi:type II secretory pathway component GspD/PulD (secretin)